MRIRRMQRMTSFKNATDRRRKALDERTISRMSSGSRIWESQHSKTSRLARVPGAGRKESVVLAFEYIRMLAPLKMADACHFKTRRNGNWIVKDGESVNQISNSKRATSGPIVRGKLEHSVLS